MRASSDNNCPPAAAVTAAVLREDGIEYGFVGKLQELKYEYRRDITDRAALEKNFREKFEALNRVKLTDSKFARLLDEIVSPDVFTAAKRERAGERPFRPSWRRSRSIGPTRNARGYWAFDGPAEAGETVSSAGNGGGKEPEIQWSLRSRA